MKDLATKLLQKQTALSRLQRPCFPRILKPPPTVPITLCSMWPTRCSRSAISASKSIRLCIAHSVASTLRLGHSIREYHDWLLTAFNKRIVADYTVSSELTANAVQTVIEQAKEFASVARRLLTGQQ